MSTPVTLKFRAARDIYRDGFIIPAGTIGRLQGNQMVWQLGFTLNCYRCERCEPAELHWDQWHQDDLVFFADEPISVEPDHSADVSNMVDDPSDDELIARYQEGDANAIAALLIRYAPTVRKIAQYKRGIAGHLSEGDLVTVGMSELTRQIGEYKLGSILSFRGEAHFHVGFAMNDAIARAKDVNTTPTQVVSESPPNCVIPLGGPTIRIPAIGEQVKLPGLDATGRIGSIRIDAEDIRVHIQTAHYDYETTANSIEIPPGSSPRMIRIELPPEVEATT